MIDYFVRVSADGQIDIVEYTGGISLLQFLREQIGCCSIENVKSLSGVNHLMVVDETFLLQRPLPRFNAVASYFYSKLEYAILGDVVIGQLGFRDGEPDFVGFSQFDALRLVSVCKRVRSALKNI